MNYIVFVKLYLIALPVFFAIDMFWLTLVAKSFYRSQLGDLLTKNVIWQAAIIFYLLYICGIIIFAIMPALEKNSLTTAITLGCLFGFFAYATYDLTNLATLRDWPLKLTIVDMVWGTVLSGSVATVSFLIARFFKLG